MSLEAWGDDDAQELPDGCWGECTVSVVQQCIKELLAEPVYEDGKKDNGISVRFLARLTILRGEAGLLDTSDPLYLDAERVLRPVHVQGSAPDIASKANIPCAGNNDESRKIDKSERSPDRG